MIDDTGIVILGHGSPVSGANDSLLEIAERIKEAGGYPVVQHAFLQFEEPDLKGAVTMLIEKGMERIVVMPYFLYMGAHVTKDLPAQIDSIKESHPEIDIVLAPPLGVHERLIEVAIERIDGVINRGGVSGIAPSIKPSGLFEQHPIEQRSFEIIEDNLDLSGFSHREIPIVKRVIHATGDFEYSRLVIFGNNPIDAGTAAIENGCDVITDVRMVEMGINRRLLNIHGGCVRCFVTKVATGSGMTRTASGIRMASPFIGGSIVAIGNSPTALREMIRLIDEEGVRPALVIGVPVGFVDAEESKDALMDSDIPFITVAGSKGGSSVAVAIVNALLLLSDGVFYSGAHL